MGYHTVSSFRAAASLFFGPRVIGMSPDCAHEFRGMKVSGKRVRAALGRKPDIE